jgi:phospholipid/cholesterol/gamma-HCH transport system substrate-binding protein
LGLASDLPAGGGNRLMARPLAIGALAAAVVVVAVLILTGGSSYTLRLNFQDAGGLVSGNQVMIGPAVVGTVNGVTLTDNGEAQVQVSLDSRYAPVHQGTVARIFENSLSGNANRYVALEPGPAQSPSIRSGGLIGESNTYSFVSLDQLFNTLDRPTRGGLRNFIQGEASTIQGRAPQAHRSLLYFAPALAATSNVTAELTRSEPVFDQLLVQGARAMSQLASRSQQLTQLVANGSAATGAIASQAQALERALSLFPGTLTGSTTTFRGLDATLPVLSELVRKARPALQRFAPFAADLRSLLNVSAPTLANLDALIHNPARTGDLTSLALETPSLAKLAQSAFPRLIKEMNDSQAQLNYLRYYAPDVVAALTNLGQIAGYYDGNGHYARTQPTFFPFRLDSLNQLQSRPPSERYKGLVLAGNRCPGGAIQAAPDGSAPWHVPGCNPNASPKGP